MSAPDSGTTQTVDASRFNKMMGAYQKALSLLTPEQRAALKDSGAVEQGQGTNDTSAQEDRDSGSDSQQTAEPEPEFEEGVLYQLENGRMVAQEPPSPLSHSEFSRSIGKPKETSLSELRAKLDREVGKPSVTHEWPDITAR
jgi:hypothetical protein